MRHETIIRINLKAFTIRKQNKKIKSALPSFEDHRRKFCSFCLEWCQHGTAVLDEYWKTICSYLPTKRISELWLIYVINKNLTNETLNNEIVVLKVQTHKVLQLFFGSNCKNPLPSVAVRDLPEFRKPSTSLNRFSSP